jgi:hypothetical protein
MQLTVSDCDIRDNHAILFGGGIYAFRSSIAITQTTISGNDSRTAGGIYAYGGELSIADSNVTDNSGSHDYGGVFSYSVAHEITRTTISNNSAPLVGGVHLRRGSQVVTDCTISGNEAAFVGGLHALDGETTIRGTTISDNVSDYHGLLVSESYGVPYGSSEFLLANNTISGNTAACGVHIESYGYSPRVTIASNTIADNSGFGLCTLIHIEPPQHLLVHGTLLSGNGGGSCNTTAGKISLGQNLMDDYTCFRTFRPNDIVGADPLLMPLADNGGPTYTHALSAESPAIDIEGDLCEPTDQRGIVRPQDGDGDGVALCDTGAFEYVPSDPEDLVVELIEDIVALELHHGMETSLLAKLNAALLVLQDVTEENDHAATNILDAFVNHVEAQRGKKIPEADADALISRAMTIGDLIDDAQ